MAVGAGQGVALYVAADHTNFCRDWAVHIPPVSLKLIYPHARFARHKLDVFQCVVWGRSVLYYMFQGQDQKRFGPINKIILVQFNGLVFGATSPSAQDIHAFDPNFRDPIIGQLPLAIATRQGVGLYIPMNFWQFSDHIGMFASPIGLEILHSHTRFAFDTSDGFNHGDLPLRHDGPPRRREQRLFTFEMAYCQY